MSRINDLIQELCPNGVIYKPLNNLLNYEQPTKYIVNATDYDSTPGVPVLTPGQTFILGYTKETDGIYQADKTNPTIIFDDFTTAFKWVDFPFKVKSSAMKMLSSRGEISLRFAWYAMQTIRYNPQNHARQWIKNYSAFEIPVPPMPVQNEIVGILDSFTSLETELEARKQQYTYLRNKLITKKQGSTHLLLGDIADIGTGSHDTKEAILNGKYTFFARGREPLRLDTFDFDETSIITAGDGVGVGKVFHFAHGKYALHQRAYRIVPYRNVDSKYIYYYLVAKFPQYLQQVSVRSSVTSLRRPMLLRFPLCLPSISEQHRVATILDKFETFQANFSCGIPAEIEARRKQYEYYRDRLLTFKELDHE